MNQRLNIILQKKVKKNRIERKQKKNFFDFILKIYRDFSY